MSRLKPGTVLAGIFAVLFAFAAAYVVRGFLVREPPPQAAAAAADTTMQVPTASSELLAGRTITLGDIAVRPMEIAAVRKLIEAKELPADFMTNPDQIVGRILRDPVKVGDTFSAALFFPEGTGPTVADKLKPGLRAVTITVTDTGLVSGFASPTTLVDVLFRSEELENFPETTFTLIEGIEVLAVGRSSYPNSQNIETDDRGRGPDLVHATLAVTPEQASILRVLEGRGEMSLSLRSPDERSVQAIEDDLLAAKGRLSIWAREENLLKQMEELSAKTGTEFKEQERLATIATEIENVEIAIEGLIEELERSRSENRKMTLASVLGIPEPSAPVPGAQLPPPPKMDLYLRGQRSSLIFDPPRQDSSSATSGPPVSAVSPASGDSPQANGSSVLPDKSTSSVRPETAPGTQPSRLPQTANNVGQLRGGAALPGNVTDAQRAAAPVGLPKHASTGRSSDSNVAERRQSDVSRALLEIDQRVQTIQENQERSLARLSKQLTENLSASNIESSGLTVAEVKARQKSEILQQQEQLNLALHHIDQRMLAMQASQEESIAKLTTQLTTPVPVSDVSATVRKEMRESVSQIDQLTDAVAALEARLREKELVTPVESNQTLSEPVADDQQSNDSEVPAAAQFAPAAVELMAGRSSSLKSPNDGTSSAQENPARESSRAFVWSPDQVNRKLSESAGKSGNSDIEIFMGRKRATSSSVSHKDESL